MNDRLLEQSSDALKRLGVESTSSGDRTRHRILLSLHDQRRVKRTRLAIVLPIAGLFMGSTAWAAASGQLPTLARAVANAVFAFDEPAPTPSVPPKPKKRSDDAIRPPPSRDDEQPASNPEPAPAAEPSRGAAAEVSRPAPRVRSRSAAPLPQPIAREASLALYRQAHSAHFGARQFEQALRGYTRYLAAAPAGSLATEARYNRGLCLAKLGRHAEARRALRPFAEGRYGAYRQSQAQRMVAALPSPLQEPSGDQATPPEALSPHSSELDNPLTD